MHALQEAQGGHKSHNTCDSHCLTLTILLSKGIGGAGKPQLKEKGCNNAKFAPIVWADFKKVVCKQLHKCKKHHANNLERDNESNYSS